ncbi:MAG: hypothetical protein ACOYOT_08975 [Bacteroidales bacterium]
MSDKAFNTKSNSQEELSKKAILTLQNGNNQEALKLFNEYIDIAEKSKKTLTIEDVMIYWNRHIAKIKLNDIDGAIKDLLKCTQICNFDSAYFELYRIYEYKRQNDLSLKYLIKAYENGNKQAETLLRKNTNYFNFR